MLKDGAIVERGTYKELMALKGEFYELVKFQTQEDKVERRKSHIERSIKQLEKKLSVKKLNTLIRTHSRRPSKVKKVGRVKYSKLKMKHLSSMTAKWKNLS